MNVRSKMYLDREVVRIVVGNIVHHNCSVWISLIYVRSKYVGVIFNLV